MSYQVTIEPTGEQIEATGRVPDDRTIVAERFRDELGDWRILILSVFGARVHAPWAIAMRRKLLLRYGIEADMVWSDDGIALRFPETDTPPDPLELFLDPEEVEDLLGKEGIARGPLLQGVKQQDIGRRPESLGRERGQLRPAEAVQADLVMQKAVLGE